MRLNIKLIKISAELGKPRLTKSDDFFQFFQTEVDPPPYFGNYLAFFHPKIQKKCTEGKFLNRKTKKKIIPSGGYRPPPQVGLKFIPKLDVITACMYKCRLDRQVHYRLLKLTRLPISSDNFRRSELNLGGRQQFWSLYENFLQPGSHEGLTEIRHEIFYQNSAKLMKR